MAAGAFTLYSNAVLEMTKAAFNFATDTYVMALVTTAYVPAPNTDATWANVSANEVATGGGYTAGGVVLGSVTDVLSAATVTFDSAAATWAAFTATFRYAVIVRRAGASLASTDLLLCYSDVGGGTSIIGGGGTLTITPNAAGLFTLTHTP